MGISRRVFDNVVPHGFTGIDVSFFTSVRPFSQSIEQSYTMVFLSERADEYESVFTVLINEDNNENGFVFSGFIPEGTIVDTPVKNMGELYDLMSDVNADISCNTTISFLIESIDDMFDWQNTKQFWRFMAGIGQAPQIREDYIPPNIIDDEIIRSNYE